MKRKDKPFEKKSDGRANGGAGVGNIILNGVLAYFFYVYTWNNPD